jgi:hypothetical protein
MAGRKHRGDQSASISVCSDDALWSVWSVWPGHSAKPALRGTASASAAAAATAADVGVERRQVAASASQRLRLRLPFSLPVGVRVCVCVCSASASTLPHTPTERIEEPTRTNSNPARPTVTLAAFPATDGQLARPPPNTLPRPHLKFIHPALHSSSILSLAPLLALLPLLPLALRTHAAKHSSGSAHRSTHTPAALQSSPAALIDWRLSPLHVA